MDRPTGDPPRLIFDVGAADGADSAYYLSRGFRVVAVEPRPDAVAQLRQRFPAELRDGRLELVAKGVTEKAGQATFWLCEDEPGWSTFDPGFARRWGERHRRLTVPTCTLRELIEEHGCPFYCKIDIEGLDLAILRDPGPQLPTYLSLEILDAIEPQIQRLRELGYRRFKLISLTDFTQPSAGLARLKARLRRLPGPLKSAYGWFRRHEREAMKLDGTGPSGPFGEEAAGQWLSAGEMIELAALVRATEADTANYDLHAAFGEA